MPRGNMQNLVQNKHQTPEQRRDSAQKAGIASGAARREKRQIQEALRRALSGQYEVGDKEENKKILGGYDAIAVSMTKAAIGGDVKAATFIRDTIGEKPKETVELENNELTGIKIKFVNKSSPKQSKETDPKIVGDYTPPLNTDDAR